MAQGFSELRGNCNVYLFVKPIVIHVCVCFRFINFNCSFYSYTL